MTFVRDPKPFCVATSDALADVLRRIDANYKGIALVVDAEGRLIDTLTDGDIRRAVLHGSLLPTSVELILADKAKTVGRRPPVTVPAGTDAAEMLAVMRREHIRHLPVLDADGKVVGLAVSGGPGAEDEDEMAMEAVIMAGGKGTRLYPLTQETPKPMLPMGDRPLLEHIVNQLRDAGIRRMAIATHYKAEKIVDHFGDGRSFGVDIDYLAEDQPLGTAGALALLEKKRDPILVMNGDIVTRIDFRALRRFHAEHEAALTVAVRHFDVKVPYGVIETEGAAVKGLREKPSVSFMVNAGIYLLEPWVLAEVPAGRRVDMTEVIELLLARGQRVVCFPIVEYWLDIGQHADYQQGLNDLGLRCSA